MINKIIFDLANLARKFGIRFNYETNTNVLEMKKALAGINNKIEFKIEQYPDGSWTAESVNIDGIITGGKNYANISNTLKDAVFTYFDIPPHLCASSLLRADNEPVTLIQRVYA